eukprot:m.109015 g.109015  ORF g.109015 m.109015 type:complete len:82 (-) comp19122_c0_seq4:164-409(-)
MKRLFSLPSSFFFSLREFFFSFLCDKSPHPFPKVLLTSPRQGMLSFFSLLGSKLNEYDAELQPFSEMEVRLSLSLFQVTTA